MLNPDMKMIKLFYILCCWFLFCGCNSQVLTIWKPLPALPPRYNKIMVVSIVKNESYSLRNQRENVFVTKLNQLGYNAISSLKEFGEEGWTGMGEEATYLKLCENGIDALLTIALIEKGDNGIAEPVNIKYTSTYYYKRIWNYTKFEPTANTSGTTSNTTSYAWESILFDLESLEPKYVCQTKTFMITEDKNNTAALSNAIISKMIKEKVLVTSKKDK